MKIALIVCSLLFCVGLSVVTFIILQRQPKIAVIDLDRVVTKLSQSLAAQYPKGGVPKPVLADLLEDIRYDMEVFARKHRVHLFAKRAFFSEAIDLTDAFLKEMEYEDD